MLDFWVLGCYNNTTQQLSEKSINYRIGILFFTQIPVMDRW